MKITIDKIIILIPIFKKIFLKSCIKDSDIQNILQNSQLLQPTLNQKIFNQGDYIDNYYFLIRGMVSLSRLAKHDRRQKYEDEEIEIIECQKVIGQYFNSLHTIREFTATIKSQYTQIVKVQKNFFDTICQPLILQYNQIENYVRTKLKINKKINILEIFNIKNYRLGSYIKLNNQIGVILSGECKILIINKQNSQNKSPIKTILPLISKIQQKQIKREVVIIGENQWIFTQNIEHQFKQSVFKYVVTSQQLCLLTFPTKQINILSTNKLETLLQIHKNRKQMVEYKERFSINRNHKRQQSYSPKIFKQKIDQANKILQKLDPNLSPKLILQKYKLGYNVIRYQHQEKQQRNSTKIQNICKLKRQKTERKIKQYYKSKDWTKYIKIPNQPTQF